MSTYSMQLRTIIEHYSQYTPEIPLKDKIEIGRVKLFDFDYPIFDEKYKKILETHFIRKFYMAEIGHETEGLFKFYLENYLTIHMPYWNKLFESELIEFNPMINTDYTVETSRDSNTAQNDNRDTTQNTSADSSRDSSGNSSDEGFTRNINSDNPDGRLALTTQEGKGVIEYANGINEDYQKNSNNAASSESVNAKGNSTQNDVLSSKKDELENYFERKVGNIGVQTSAYMLNEFRTTFIRIENDMFKEMRKDLFMLVY